MSQRILGLDLGRVEEAVRAAESRTDAEVVVAVSKASASYVDLELLVGAAFGLAAFAATVWSPAEIPHGLAIGAVALSAFAGQALAARVAAIRRLLASPARRRGHAVEAARLAFFEERVAATSKRIGVLLYLAPFEREVVVVADIGVDAKVPPETWDGIAAKVAGAPRFDEAAIGAIGEIGEALARAIPKTEGDTDELSNAARVRA